MKASAVVRLERVRKVYGTAPPLEALRHVTLSIPAGSFCVIEGPSGSGKTTLLAIAGGLEHPTSGRVWLGDTEITGLDGGRLLAVRRDWLGFVFQDFKLIDVLTAEENVALALELRGAGSGPARARSRALLGQLGLNGRARNRPGALSGGEKQRVAIARALSTSPRVLLADEPTANLDWAAGSEVVALLRSASRALGTAVVVVSHDPRVAAHADRVVRIADGVIDEDGDVEETR